MLTKVGFNAQAFVEKALAYRFRGKEEERSNHAVKIAAGGPITVSCPHMRIAWSGPPHNAVQAITCLDCQSWVTEPEMKDRGYKFEDCPDWIFFAIMDERAKRVLLQGNPTLFVARR